MNSKATPRLADVPAAQNDGPSPGAVGPAPSLHHWAASAWVAWCVSCRATTCHGPACRTANNAARFCLSRSPLVFRDRSCREGVLGWLIEPPRGCRGRFPVLCGWFVLPPAILAVADVVGMEELQLSATGFFFFLVTGKLSTLRQMMKVPNEPGLSPNKQTALSATALSDAGSALELSDCTSEPHNKRNEKI